MQDKKIKCKKCGTIIFFDATDLDHEVKEIEDYEYHIPVIKCENCNHKTRVK